MKSTPFNAAGSDQPQSRPAWWTWVLMGVGGFFLFMVILLSILKGPPSTWLPAHIHSVLSADYSQDPRGNPIAQVKFSVIRDLLSDSTARGSQSGGPDPDQRFAAVINEMETPVPTVTPMPGSTVFVPTVISTMTATPPLPTQSVGTPPATQRPSMTPTSTATFTLTPTATSFLGQGTATGRPPTQGPSATRTSGPPATRTSGPSATNTPRPTQPPATATPRPTRPPTATSVPPTNPPYPQPTPYP